ncbi:HD domain-containing protein [Patulibacter sp. SYSU D01012]|uniref:HD domain-containing protein n=1 Tax=Patulibacter sp. SYSU D01012 TaxID=2817381 RepID=UPI0032C06231
MPRAIPRDEAWDLLTSWVQEESLRRHCLAVEASMRAQARAAGEDEELWGVTGLLHDADYERHPDAETGHPASSSPSSSGATRRSRCATRSRDTPRTWASRARRPSPGRCSPSTSSPGS